MSLPLPYPSMLLRARRGEEAAEAPVSAVGVDKLMEAAREAMEDDGGRSVAWWVCVTVGNSLDWAVRFEEVDESAAGSSGSADDDCEAAGADDEDDGVARCAACSDVTAW